MKRPEFNGIPEHVWEYLNQIGRTIPEIMVENKMTYNVEPNDSESRDKPLWHNKKSLDKYVANKLGLRMEDYDRKNSSNELYVAIANELSTLRKARILIDWQTLKNKGNSGIGIWRLDKTKFEKFAKEQISVDLKAGNYYSSGELNTIVVREKQAYFRKILLAEYSKCAFCGFKPEKYVVGAHIVPYSTIRIDEPENSMNPTNGLLLCKLCDIAFETGDIMLETDLGITISDILHDNRDLPVKSWINNIESMIRPKNDAKYIPNQKYIKWKQKLLEHSN